MHHDVAESIESRARRGIEHGVQRARLGVDQDRRHLRIVDVARFAEQLDDRRELAP
jgi:hypothetical protein